MHHRYVLHRNYWYVFVICTYHELEFLICTYQEFKFVMYISRIDFVISWIHFVISQIEFTISRIKFMIPRKLISDMYCHQGSWLNRSDRKRGEWELTPFLFNSFTSLFNSYEHVFRHDGNTAFVRTFYYNVTAKPLYRVPAAFAPRDSEPARRGDRLLSHVEMSRHETLTRKKTRTER